MRKFAKLLCALTMTAGMITPVHAEETAYEKALRAAAEAREKVSSIEAQLAEGSVGFFRWHGDSTAIGIVNTGIERGRSLGLSAGLTRIGKAGDATSLDNMKKAVTFIREGNELRASEGASALYVTDRMMALAEVNTNYAYENYYHWLDHLSTYNAAENYSYWYTDPYDYWYTLEKHELADGTGSAPHYFNLINTSYSVTGFGVNTVSAQTHYCQDFGGPWCMSRLSGTVGQKYTVSEYEKSLNTYISTMNSDLAAAKKTLEAALAELKKYEGGGYLLGSAPASALVGDTLNLSVLVSGREQTAAVWKSSSSAVASVNQNGAVTCKKTGTVTITASSPTGNKASTTLKVYFTDVPASGVYYSTPVYWAVDNAITNGYFDEDGFARTFGPERNCTRAQMVTFMWRLAGRPEPKSSVSRFSDLTDSSLYYYKAVLWASEKGITTGYSDGTFRPDETCLREHAVTFLYRYAGEPAVSGTNPFNDIAETDYYYRPSVWASANGIAKGYSEGEYAGGFGPELDCLREHIVTFLYRYAN